MKHLKLVISGFEVLASSLGFTAAPAFVSDERVLKTSASVWRSCGWRTSFRVTG
jgi:hypothetical protein